MKYCPGCETEKDTKLFSKDSRSKSGLQAYCKACQKNRRPPKDRAALKIRLYRAKNPEKARVACRGYYWRNHDDQVKRMADYRASNPGKAYASVKAWRERNPTVVIVLNQNRRCREAQAEGAFTTTEWADKQTEYNYKCAYCHKLKKLTVHHVVPLAIGGTNWISNIVPACRLCNSAIGANVVIPEEACHH
jgi:hypothetical protein